MADLSTMMERERQKLNTAKAEALTRRTAIDDEIATIDKELAAIAAYEAAMLGKTVTATKRTGGGKRGSRQEGILQLLKDAPDGLGRADILEKLGLKGNKTGEQSISNALNNMKKARKIGAKDGRYVLA